MTPTLAALCALLLAPAPVPSTGPDAVADWIEKGRALLDAAKPLDAESAFLEADRLGGGGGVATRMWVLRAWMDQGRINDALDAIDALKKTGAKGADLDYLYGMAFARRFENLLATDALGTALQMNLRDAQQYLARATREDALRYRDAFLPLSEACWRNLDLDPARAAAERAVTLYDKSPAAWLQLGRVALSQYKALQGRSESKSLQGRSESKSLQGRSEEERAAERHRERARDAFQRCIAASGEPAQDAGCARLSEAALQLAYAHQLEDEREPARAALRLALEWDPRTLDYGLVQGWLEPSEFRELLGAGEAAFQKRFGEEDARDADLLWWLGAASFQAESFADAAKSFLGAVRKKPALTSSWYWMARSHYANQNYRGAIACFQKHWDVDAPDLVKAVLVDEELNMKLLDWLAWWCAEKANNRDAAFLSAVMAEANPRVSRYWNNAGLFLRDQAVALEKLAAEKADESKRAEVAALFEQSYAAYSRAVELEPEHPNYLNDTALILHYHLKRDLAKAMAMYAKANKNAKALLADRRLTPERRKDVEKAERDSAANIEKLQAELAGKGASVIED